MADGVVLRINKDPVSLLPEYAAQHERFFAAVGMVADANSGLAVREGKRLGPGLEVTVNADGLSVDVQPGLAVVRHALDTGGDYHVAIPVAVNKVLAAKPGVGLKRRDLVVLDVLDEDTAEKPTTAREVNIEVLEGTPTAGTPTAPAAGLMRMQLAQVHFDGTSTPIIQPTNIPQTWASGGIGVVFSLAERDNITAYDGMKIYRSDLSLWQGRRDGVWVDEGSTDTGWLYAGVADGWSASIAGGFTYQHGTRIRRIGNRCRLEITCAWDGVASIPPGKIDSEDQGVFTITDSVFLPPSNPEGGSVGENVLAFTVGHEGTGGGMVGMVINQAGDVEAWSITSQLANNDVVRAVFEYLLD